jgi:hypothetical protein
MSAEKTILFLEDYVKSTQNRRNIIFLTGEDIAILRNSIFNIFFNSNITFSESDIRYFKRHSTNLKILASKQTKTSTKREIAHKNRSLIRHIAIVILNYIKI